MSRLRAARVLLSLAVVALLGGGPLGLLNAAATGTPEVEGVFAVIVVEGSSMDSVSPDSASVGSGFAAGVLAGDGPRPTAPPGFIYAQGTKLLRDGVEIQLFGPDEATAFIYALDGAGLWGGAPNPNSWGKNQLFPSGPDTRISGATNLDSHWREFFRYFLHYQEVAGSAGHPKPNVVRIWVNAQNWREEGSYLAWQQDPTAFFQVFDRMVYWAKRANVYIVPILGHSESGFPQTTYFNTGHAHYAHQIEFARAVMTRYDNEPQIAMWDLWNEADVNNGAYWNPLGGIYAYRSWITSLTADLRPYSANHLFTIGHGVTSAEYFFDNGPGFTLERHLLFNDIPGLDVSHDHTYMTAEDQYMIDLEAAWHAALGRPHYTGEVGYNLYPGPSPYGYGYWPWFIEHGRAAGFAAMSPMVFWDNGRGVYTDYPYTGALPQYPSPTGFDFSVSLNPASASIAPGLSTSTTVTVSLTTGSAQAVNLTATGLPSVTTASFSPATCTPSCSSTLTLATSGTTPTGAYSVTVSASGGGTTRSAPFALTVGAPCPSSPPSFPAASWDRVWCDATLTNHLANTPDESVERFDNNWGTGVVAGIRADNLGFRSGRTITFPATGEYSFTVGGDDGIRVWIDGTQLLDKWFQQPYTQYTFSRSLAAGAHQVRLDFYEGPGEARVSFDYILTSTTDTTPPFPTTDLRARGTGTTNVTLAWTAPGDDGASGTASAYDLRYSSSGPLNGSNFASATPVPLPAPATAGSAEVAEVAGLASATRYWFALRTADEVPNWSPLSNVLDVTTGSPPPPPDTTPPARVLDLTVVSTGTDRVSLRWTAPGDDGSSGQATGYDLRHTTSGPITDGTFQDAVHYETSFPKAAGSTEDLTVLGLSSGTTYWFALIASDEVPNRSTASNTPSGTTTPGNVAPTASFTSSASSVLVGEIVSFDAASSSDPDGTIVSYGWAFGDGDAATTATPSAQHAYRVAGAYTVILVVTDDGGLTDDASGSISVAPVAVDTTRPAAVTDLRIFGVTKHSVALRWTAPGDDGTVGLATWYDLRISLSGPITDANFYDTSHYEIAFPKASGLREQVSVSGLRWGVRYWFAIRASDEVPNWSDASNSPSGVTSGRYGASSPLGMDAAADLLGAMERSENADGALGFLLLAIGLSVLALLARSRTGRGPSSPHR